ncbi:hypothetical protein L7F22_040728 [Adiantum nelumboides]|nr:hypothetical protein [Adiantum nelumboides]
MKMALRLHKFVRRRALPSLWSLQWPRAFGSSSCSSSDPSSRHWPRPSSSSLHSYRAPLFKLASIGQYKSIFIQTQSTPNPLSLMFYPGKPVMDVGSADFPNSRVGMSSPLAKALFRIDGVTRVFFGSDFVTVTKAEDFGWDLLKPEVFAAIMDFYTSNQPLFYDAKVSSPADTAIKEDDDETVAMIKELLETRIRPAVQDDGGDIEYQGYDAFVALLQPPLPSQPIGTQKQRPEPVKAQSQLIEVANIGNGLLKEEDCEFNTSVKEGSGKKYLAKYFLKEAPKMTQEPTKTWKSKATAEPTKGPAKKWKPTVRLVPDMVGDKPYSDASELCRAWSARYGGRQAIFRCK